MIFYHSLSIVLYIFQVEIIEIGQINTVNTLINL